MENRPIIVFLIVLFSSITFYMLSKRVQKKTRKSSINTQILKDKIFSDVELAILGEEFSGLNPNKNPFKIENKKKNFELPLELIVNGKIIEGNLSSIHKNHDWLLRTINKKGFSKVEDVSYAVLDSSGELNVH